MTHYERTKIRRMFQEKPDDFSCKMCVDNVHPTSCKGCPVYFWGKNDE